MTAILILAVILGFKYSASGKWIKYNDTRGNSIKGIKQKIVKLISKIVEFC